MNENGRKKREWIKTAAIVFLSVMLVLTFFSNTIQNWSLPEVATQYVTSGTITAKIRGTGSVESTDPYDVKVTETRKVDSVAVRTGDKVKEGDVLIYLAAGDGEELKAAKDALEEAQKKYDEAILSDKMSVSDIAAAGQGMTAESYRTQLTLAQNAVKAAKNAVEPRKAEVARITELIEDFNKQKAYEQSMNDLAPERVAAAKKAMENAESAKKRAEAYRDGTALNEKNQAQERLNQAQKDLTAWTQGFNSVSAGDAGYMEAYEAEKQRRQEALDAARENLEDKNNRYNEAVDEANNKAEEYNDAVNSYNDAVNYQAEREQSDVILDLNDSLAGLDVELYNANKELKAAEDDLKAKEENLTELLGKIGNVTALQSYLDAIEKAQKKVDELEEKAEGTTITAPISGIVTTINVRAGENATAATPVVVMQREGRGYTLSFSVTNEQARRLSVGDKADLVNAWRYDDVNVTLASIRPDTSNPSQNKLLTFNVEGNVVAGQNLSLSVGQKSANYDFIVPNSAIREDSNGKFILKVESKSSPLGTRYTARRVDVTVIASDDKQSAVSGALEGYEFVITTSTKPVESGKLVRLTD